MSVVLVMNKGWAPIEVWNLFKAVKSVYKGKAQIVDRHCNMYKWEEWVENWSDAKKIAENSFRSLHATNFTVAAPEVIILKEYNGYIHKSVKLTRRNVFVRDGGKCQYCGIKDGERNEKRELITLNVDHVIPQGQGGKTRWKNVVLACDDCNQSKGCRTPDQAGMVLKRKPFAPKWYHMHSNELNKTLTSWTNLFSEMYWNVGLEE